KLAGVPDSVIARAKELVLELMDADISKKAKEIAMYAGAGTTKKKAIKYDEVDLAQMSLFDTVTDDDILEEIKSLDIGNLTPIDALNTLYKLQGKLNNRYKG
ncbi:MAG: DNA mismatch repair protein MutS, partial [Lachnospiraceae bacterium]|nr:DNA mismatch repair protein MutS [Lachnospiraceae bacterium]